MDPYTDISPINQWRSIVTLIVFILTNIVVLFPFHIPIYVPRPLWVAGLDALGALRIISRRQHSSPNALDDDSTGKVKKRFILFRFPMNFVTAPLIADLFLLAILAIGRTEVHDGTIGANNISPIDIMIFFVTLAYIAISIDASGLIRYLAFKVLQWGGKVGQRLFFFLYIFFFGLGSFIGNDPIILSGTAFLAYMTRVARNIEHPRAWIHTQFAVANTASAILVSSNPTNLVLAGAFQIRFIDYTANMIVPVVVTAIVLFPFLLYIVFASESLIPFSIEMHQLPEEIQAKKPVNPNIPHARGEAEEEENNDNEQGKLLSLEEIMNPFLDKRGAAFGAIIMATTLITLLALNAANTDKGGFSVFWVTLPAAFVMFCWDIAFGWMHRDETRKIAREGRREVEEARERRAAEEAAKCAAAVPVARGALVTADLGLTDSDAPESLPQSHGSRNSPCGDGTEMREQDGIEGVRLRDNARSEVEKKVQLREIALDREHGREPATLVSLAKDLYQWSQETFPTATAVLDHLPYALVPFALSMFVLVQALVTKGWVPVFAYGWDHWVSKTGTVGAIGGMGFLAVIFCNFAGTNIGTTILLCRMIQSWEAIHKDNGTPISNRDFWATVYSMALGVNFGAYSTAFSASLAGLLWRDILSRKHIHVHRLEFARVNLPIIAIAMTVGCAVLTGEVYIMRDQNPFPLSP